MKIRYVGPAKDYSGYGEACRHDIGSLVSASVSVTAKVPNYTMEISDFGKLGELVDSIKDLPLGYKISILHTTPNVYRQYMEPEKYHIGRVFWETNKLPLDFAQNVELMDEIWTGSKFNADAIRNAGVTKPIYIIPEAIDGSLDIDSITPYKSVFNDDDFVFYSIFEWTERKNPITLLSAYYQEFKSNEKVGLVIKTYVDNFTRDKRKEIDNDIKRLKSSLGLKEYPPVYLYRELMDRRQIYRFHKSFDCFVSAHRGEGWGIPQMEAMLMGKPIISTNCGGIHEYIKHGTNGFLVKNKLIPLRGNTRNKQWYTPDQKWAEVNIDDLRRQMRKVYTDREMAKKVGENARQLVLDTFDMKVVGQRMRKRLHAIEDEILYPTVYPTS